MQPVAVAVAAATVVVTAAAATAALATTILLIFLNLQISETTGIEPCLQILTVATTFGLWKNVQLLWTNSIGNIVQRFLIDSFSGFFSRLILLSLPFCSLSTLLSENREIFSDNKMTKDYTN